MDILHVLCVVSVAITGLTEGAGLLPDGPLDKAVGGKVIFNTTLTPQEKTIYYMNWRFGDRDIITATTVNTTTPEYEGRITYFPSTGSLELRGLTLNDSGEYRVTITLNGGQQQDGSTRLDVSVPVSNVTVTPKSADLVEFNSSVSLSCSSSGSFLSFLWMNGSSQLTGSDRVHLTDGNSTLTIVNVTRYDQGPFRCHVFNPISSGTSDPVNLSISFGPENIKLSPSEVYTEEGSNISLICSAESRPSAQFMWFVNGDKLSDTEPELRLMNIQTSQSGNYSCQAFNDKTMRYQTSEPSVITVLVPVSNVTVTPISPDLVEFKSSVSLSCSSSGSFLSFLWMNGSSQVTGSDRVHLTDGNSTLTIVNVTRYDQGPFRCHVFNPFSSGTSDPVNLSINYGPENIKLTLQPPQKHFEKGYNISLICSAESRPSAQFMWFVNGDKLPDTGPELRLMNIQTSQSGNYNCQAFNDKTMRYQTSQPSTLSVLEKISGASVHPSTNDSLVEGTSFNLTCEASGSIVTRNWMKDDSALILTDNITLHDNNRVLMFNTVTRKDSGEYLCSVINPISSDRAKYSMTVNYGPETVQITGPSQIHLKEMFKLICSAESTPAASYTWIFNGREILSHSAEFVKEAELSDSGNYTCQARNNRTGRISSSVVHGLTVTENEKSPKCSVGCIVGIVVACCAVIAVIAGVSYYVWRKKKCVKNSSNRKTSTTSGGAGLNNAGFSSQELHYADVTFVKNKNGGRVKLGSQNTSESEYAQVKVPAFPPTYDAHVQRAKKPSPHPEAYGEEAYAKIVKK